MKLTADEKYGIVAGIIFAGIFGVLAKGTFNGLLAMDLSFNPPFILQATICYTFFALAVSSLATPVMALREAIKRNRVSSVCQTKKGTPC